MLDVLVAVQQEVDAVPREEKSLCGAATSAVDVKARLALIELHAAEVADLVDGETNEWLTEFRANITNFVTQTPAGTNGP